MFLQFGPEGCSTSLMSASDASYDDFLAALPSDQACYAVVAVQYRLESGAFRSKLGNVNKTDFETYPFNLLVLIVVTSIANL